MAQEEHATAGTEIEHVGVRHIRKEEVAAVLMSLILLQKLGEG